jgi:hypothetical protein
VNGNDLHRPSRPVTVRRPADSSSMTREVRAGIRNFAGAWNNRIAAPELHAVAALARRAALARNAAFRAMHGMGREVGLASVGRDRVTIAEPLHARADRAVAGGAVRRRLGNDAESGVAPSAMQWIMIGINLATVLRRVVAVLVRADARGDGARPVATAVGRCVMKCARDATRRRTPGLRKRERNAAVVA